MTKLIIEVRGGNVSAILSNTESIEIVVLDYDNGELDPYKREPDAVLSSSGISDYIQNILEA